MSTMLRVLLTAGMMLGPVMLAVPAADVYTLTSGAVSMGFDVRTGEVVSLNVGGRELLARTSPPFWVRALTDPRTRESEALDWAMASSVSVDIGSSGDGEELTATYSGLRDGLSITVRWRACADSEGVVGSIEVDNASGRILEDIEFPFLVLTASPGNAPEKIHLFMPGGDGYVADREGLVTTPWHYRTYPGSASMQFMALYDDAGGVSLQCRDARARPKSFIAQYDADSDTVALRVQHHLPFVVDQGFASGPVCLVPCGPSWMSAAMSYRRWAREQWWAQAKTGESAIPQWLREGLLVLGAYVRPLGTGYHVVPYDEWDEIGRQWQQATGASSIAFLAVGWENKGYYTSPFYFPFYPSRDSITTFTSQARRAGFHVIAMVSGLKWMIEREAHTTQADAVPAFDGREAFEQIGRHVCVVGRDGRIVTAGPTTHWDGHYAYMCPAHDFTRSHWQTVARELASAGFAQCEFDQMNGGYCPPCYSTDHGHPPGYGTWIRESIADFIGATRQLGRQYYEDFSTSLEDPAEVLLPQLDAYMSRANHSTTWPAAGVGTRVVPAFAFVYHPLARAYLADVLFTQSADELASMARGFVAGAVPNCNMAWFSYVGQHPNSDIMPTPDRLAEPYLRMLAAITRMQSGPGLDYLSFGEMLWPDPLRLEPTAGIEPSAVTHSAWEVSDGRRAFFFANCSEHAVTFPYSFGVMGHKPKAGCVVGVSRNGQQVKHLPLADLGLITLEPYSTLMVEFANGAYE